VGITTSPAHFLTATQKNHDRQRIQQILARGGTAEEVLRCLMADTVRDATDRFSEVYCRTCGYDGQVTIGIDPHLAHNTVGIINHATQLFGAVKRNNILIDIPATHSGLPALTAIISNGISVNATGIYSLERYTAVMQAYLTGLEQAHQSGLPLDLIHSTASFPLARLDAEIDRQLLAIGSAAARALLGKAGIALATLALHACDQTFTGDRWATLASAKANRQRPIWVSTNLDEPADPASAT
jgi:transaldolase